MALYRYGSSSTAAPPQPPVTEFEILKASHKFLREDDDGKNLSWDDQVAQKYYSSLYREFAVCDLKHYKTGNFALRWRTETEVLDGAGETTCGNTRCVHHATDEPMPSLSTLELPFAYEEQGEAKSALVKMVLCGKCVKRLMWKREKEKLTSTESLAAGLKGERRQEHLTKEHPNANGATNRSRNSRSRSPQPRHKAEDSRSRRRSPRPGPS